IILPRISAGVWTEYGILTEPAPSSNSPSSARNASRVLGVNTTLLCLACPLKTNRIVSVQYAGLFHLRPSIASGACSRLSARSSRCRFCLSIGGAALSTSTIVGLVENLPLWCGSRKQTSDELVSWRRYDQESKPRLFEAWNETNSSASPR